MPTLLVFTPHPDDEAYAFGGLICVAVRAGWRVMVNCATSGEKGKRHDGGPPTHAAVAARREAEIEESCRLLGAEQPGLWRFPDGGLKHLEGHLIERCDAAVRGLQPDLVATLGRDGAYGHPDHIALHRAVEAVFASAGERSALIFAVFPQGLFLPQYEQCLAMMGEPPEPAPGAIGGGRWDWRLDIHAVRQEKLAAIGAHRTQLPGGDPRAIFPTGIVDALLDSERYAFARPATRPVRGLVEELGGKFAARSH